MIKKLLLMIVTSVLLIGCLNTVAFMEDGHIKVAENDTLMSLCDEEGIYRYVDAFGNVYERDMKEEEKQVKAYNEAKQNTPSNAGNTDVIEYGVVNFKTKENNSLNTTFTYVDGRNTSGYTNGYYAADGAFLGYSEDGKQVKFVQAGVTGWVDASEVEVLDYDDNNEVKSVNYYAIKNGKLYHYITTDIKQPYYSTNMLVGYKPSYMKEGVPYFSYDGHYFYATYHDMIDDYKEGKTEKALNKAEPYYNYYQFLSHRSETNITKEMIDTYTLTLLNKITTTPEKSKLYEAGQYFKKYEAMYGTNALLMYGVSINESYWGLSTIAQDKNNLFGHGAVDSNPYYGANGYESPDMSILYHSKMFVSEGYLDPKDYSNRFWGGHLGDKNSGMNVKYASDPYWGEKAAQHCWAIYDYFQNQSDLSLQSKDAYKYTIAMQKGLTTLNIRKEATSNSTAYYQSKAISSFPYLVLEEVEGQSVNGNKKWFKIQSDTPLTSDRSDMVQDNGLYDFKKDYAYISSEYATIVNEGHNYVPEEEKPEIVFDVNEYLKKAGLSFKDTYVMGIKANTKITSFVESLTKIDTNVKVTIDENGHGNSNKYVATNMVLKLTDANNKTYTYTVIVKADVNKDGKVSSADYLIIKDSIMGKYNMNDVQKKAADVNGDGKVSAPDYLMIKDSIMGKIKL